MQGCCLAQINRRQATMTTLHEYKAKAAEQTLATEKSGAERRRHRRHEMDHQGIPVDRWDGARRTGQAFGQIVDLSAGGVRIRTEQKDVKADNQIRVRMELPDYAGISPFIDTTEGVKPKREWVGWMAVTSVSPIDSKRVDDVVRLVDMDDIVSGL